MGKGATYWGNENGESTETDNKSGRPDCYPGTQSTAGPMTPAGVPGAKDSIVVPDEKKKW